MKFIEVIPEILRNKDFVDNVQIYLNNTLILECNMNVFESVLQDESINKYANCIVDKACINEYTEFCVYMHAPDRYFACVKGVNPETVILPKRGTKFSAGYDFFAPCKITVPAYGRTKIIPFNVKACMPGDEYLMCVVRSSIGCKRGIQLAQGVAIIDADYFENYDNDGNIGFCFVNNTDKDHVIEKGERCVQGIFCMYNTTVNDNINAVRAGGYGSTGKGE